MVRDRRPDPGRSDRPIRITTAPDSPAKERTHRERRYVLSMTFRTFCFLGAVAARGTWACWVLIIAALVLPYIAVVMANAASPRLPGAELQDPTGPNRQLGGASHEARHHL